MNLKIVKDLLLQNNIMIKIEKLLSTINKSINSKYKDQSLLIQKYKMVALMIILIIDTLFLSNKLIQIEQIKIKQKDKEGLVHHCNLSVN